MISRRSTGKLTSLAITVALPVGLAGVANAAPINWISDGTTFSGSYGNTAHWDAVPPAVPTASDDAIFNNNQVTAYTVTLDNARFVNGFNVQNDNVIVDLVTHDLDYGVNDFNVGNGDGQIARLTLTSSAASGQGSVIGTGNEVLNIAVGTNADGAMTIMNGATFTRGGSNNVTIASGSGAKGALTVKDGGIAGLGGSTVTWGSGAFDHADIRALNGGILNSAGPVTIAGTGAGTVDVLVDDATWTHTHASSVSFGGTATPGQAAEVGAGATINITIRNGGVASNSRGYEQSSTLPARSRGKEINILVTGDGSSMRSGYHYIGGGSTSAVESDHEVTVADNATLGVQTILKIWQAADSNGNSTFGDDGVLTLNNGFIEVKGGTSGTTPVAPGEVVVQGKLRGTGTIQRQAGTGTDPFSITVAASGELRPGDLLDNTPAIGTLTVTEGNVIFGDDGTYFVDVNALGQSDLLNITGNLDLSSLLDTLTVTGTAGGQTYTIAQYSGTLTGQFNSVSLPVGYSVDYGTGSNSAITLVVPEPASLGLLGLGGMLLLTRRRRSKLRV